MIIWCHQSGSSMVMAVDAVLVLCVSPACNNTKYRHSTQQTLFVPLSMNTSALDLSISTYYQSLSIFLFINTPFLWNNIPTYQSFTNNNCKLFLLPFSAFLTYCFCTYLCFILYMLLFCALYVLLFLDKNW